MTIAAENITFDEAIQMSQAMNNTSYFWIIDEDVIGIEIPLNHSFESLDVVWHNFTDSLSASAVLPSTKDGIHDIILNIKEGGGYFSNLKELRTVYPKLFEAKGCFGILQM